MWLLAPAALSLCPEKGRVGAKGVPRLALFPRGVNCAPGGLRGGEGNASAALAAAPGWDPSPSCCGGLAGAPPAPGTLGTLLLLLRTGARESTSRGSSFTQVLNVLSLLNPVPTGTGSVRGLTAAAAAERSGERTPSLSKGWSKAAGAGRAGRAGASLGFLQTLGEDGCRRLFSRSQICTLGVCLSFPFCKVGGRTLLEALA